MQRLRSVKPYISLGSCCVHINSKLTALILHLHAAQSALQWPIINPFTNTFMHQWVTAAMRGTVYLHWKNLEFSALPKDTWACGQLEPGFKLSTLLFSVCSPLYQLSNICPIYMKKVYLVYCAAGHFQSHPFLFLLISCATAAVKPTNILGKLPNCPRKQALLSWTYSLRRCGGLKIIDVKSELRKTGPLISLHCSACVDTEPAIVIIIWRHYFGRSDVKIKGSRSCDYLCSGWEPSRPYGPAYSGSFIWDSHWPLANWHYNWMGWELHRGQTGAAVEKLLITPPCPRP